MALAMAWVFGKECPNCTLLLTWWWACDELEYELVNELVPVPSPVQVQYPWTSVELTEVYRNVIITVNEICSKNNRLYATQRSSPSFPWSIPMSIPMLVWPAPAYLKAAKKTWTQADDSAKLVNAVLESVSVLRRIGMGTPDHRRHCIFSTNTH